FPEARLLENGCKDDFGAIESTIETIEEPFQPERNVEISFLCGLQDVVVRCLLLLDLRRHAVEALRAFLRPRKSHIGKRTGNASVSLLKGWNDNKPRLGMGYLDTGTIALALNQLVKAFISLSIAAALGAS